MGILKITKHRGYVENHSRVHVRIRYGWRWAHKVSSDLVHWFPLVDALAPVTLTLTLTPKP